MNIINPWKVISAEDVESIHQATLRVLSEVGIILSHARVRDLLLDAGASLKEDRVLLPPEMVENSIKHCGKETALTGRNGEEIVIGNGSLHWHNLGGAREVYDQVSAQARPAYLQDVRDSTRLLDALDQATTITPFFTPQDVPGELMSLSMYRHALPHTTKPLQGPGVQIPQEVRYAVLMAEVIGPVEKVLSMSVSPVSPLSFPSQLVESISQIAQAGHPICPPALPDCRDDRPIFTGWCFDSAKCRGACEHRYCSAAKSWIADHLLWSPGDDGTQDWRLNLGWRRTGNRLCSHGANCSLLWLTGECIRFIY